jgi:hypothetical protein
MSPRVRRTTVYHCSLERAFKAPILGDVRQIHTGFGPMPAVTHCTDDADWGAVGSAKRVHMAPTLGFGGGFASMDRVLARVENERWTIEVSGFQGWMLGFTRFVGDWETRALAPGEVEIVYTYTLHAGAPWLAPLQWLFAHTFWWVYMGRVLENVRRLAESNGAFPHDRPASP